LHVHLGGPGGVPDTAKGQPDFEKQMERELAAYLYCGVTAVRSVGDSLDDTLKLRARLRSGEVLGAELFADGPMFTAEGGHGTEYFKELPEAIRKLALAETVRAPKSAEEARAMVRELKAAE